jgi:UMF1 family MFS transporter
VNKRRWLNKEVFGWAMFDFANQAFTLVILTTMFHVYFVSHVVAGDESRGRQLWAVSGIIALLAVIGLSPLIGALADFSGAKKRLLFTTYVVSVILTASLGLVAPGQVTAGMTLFIVGYSFYAIGENFMAAFLPELAAHRDMGKVSAFGWTLGYVGGLTCPPGQNMLTVGFYRLGETFRAISHYRQLFRYLAIMTFYLGGMQIVIWFAGSIAKKLFGLSDQQMAVYILVLTVTAVAGALATGRFQDRIGTRRTIMIALALWLAVMAAAPFAQPGRQYMFWVMGSGVGLGMGALGTASRAMVGLFSPQHKAAEFFGFYGLGLSERLQPRGGLQRGLLHRGPRPHAHRRRRGRAQGRHGSRGRACPQAPRLQGRDPHGGQREHLMGSGPIVLRHGPDLSRQRRHHEAG